METEEGRRAMGEVAAQVSAGQVDARRRSVPVHNVNFQTNSNNTIHSNIDYKTNKTTTTTNDNNTNHHNYTNNCTDDHNDNDNRRPQGLGPRREGEGRHPGLPEQQGPIQIILLR